MENNWEKVKLADVADINSSTFRTNDFDEILYLDTSSVTKGTFGDFIKLSRNDIIPSRAKRAVKNNTIVYSTVRPNLQHFGILKCPKENTVVSTGFANVDAKDNINPVFLYYNLTQDKYTDYLHTIAANNVSAYPSINPSDLEKLELEIPDLPTQRCIAAVLSCLDEKIALNNRINDNLEAMAKAIYGYWFVQNADEKWERKSLYDIATYTNGLACQNYRPKGKEAYKVIKIREMRYGFTVDTELVDINIPQNIIVNDGDILFSWSASLEVMIWAGGVGGLNQHIFKVTSEKYPKSFVYFQLLNYLETFRMIANNRRTTMGHITIEHLKQSRIFVPTSDIIRKVDSMVSPILSQQVELKQQNKHLTALHDYLLPLLMNGQVSVKNC
jgi:type I restriction enzyme S subunit